MLKIHPNSDILRFIRNFYHIFDCPDFIRNYILDSSRKNPGIFVGNKSAILLLSSQDSHYIANGAVNVITSLSFCLLKRYEDLVVSVNEFPIGSFQENEIKAILNKAKNFILRASKILNEDSTLSDFTNFTRQNWFKFK